MARLTPEELERLGLDPRMARRRRRLASRTFVALLIRWRYFVSSFTVLATLLGTMAFALVATRDVRNDSTTAPTLAAPSLNEINRSIALGERYVTSLFKPLPGEMAVQSEASGVPIRAYFAADKSWVLLGEEKRQCDDSGDNCQFTTDVNPIRTGERDEKYNVAFASPRSLNALSVDVTVNWAYRSNQIQIKLAPLRVEERVELWLDAQKLVTLNPDSTAPTSHVIRADRQALLRMLRFTIRHATQEAYLYWSTYGNDPKKALALARFLEANDYTPGYDMRAPLFGRTSGLSDDLPFDEQAYPDCEHVARANELSYAYRSKVCLFRWPYLNIGARDPFLQAWQAITTLQQYQDPNKEHPKIGTWLQGDTPAQIARHLQGQWNRTGYGIPKCTPFSCNEMSGIRTSIFGALQAKLGYTYGQEGSKKFADAAARMIVTAQIGADGTFRKDDSTFYRPGQVGAYLAAWDTADGRFTPPSSPKLVAAIAFFVTNEDPIPPEYEGIVPSNSETSLDALGFLHLYRCERYKVCT